MKKIESLKRITCLLGLLISVSFFTLGCGASNTSTKNEKTVAASKSEASKELKEVKVSKPNEGGLKQELSTKATFGASNKKQVTFEVPASQLQGLKVGDALAINSGKDAYPATILTLPQAQPQNPNSATKVIVTAQVGPGIDLPGNKRDYTVTYLYNNRDPRSHYIKKNYVYYDDSRPYVYITGPDRVIRKKYIRVGLINRYYTEILDELDRADRIVETYVNHYVKDYVNNVVVPSIIEDYTNQVVNEYQDYINTLNERWDYDDEVNTFTINVDDVDWETLEKQDIVLTDDDITEIYEEVQTQSYNDENDTQNSEVSKEGSSLYGNPSDDNDNKNNDDKDDSKNDDIKDDKNNDETDNLEVSTNKDDDKDETSEQASYKSDSNVEVTSAEDQDVNSTEATTYNNDTNSDDNSYNNVSNDNNSQDEAASNNDSNDSNNSYDNNSGNDDSGNGSGVDDAGNDETTTSVASDDNG